MYLKLIGGIPMSLRWTKSCFIFFSVSLPPALSPSRDDDVLFVCEGEPFIGKSLEFFSLLFTWADRDRTRGNGFKLKEGKNRLDVKRKFSTHRAVRPWHCCPGSCGCLFSWRCPKADWMGPWAPWSDGGGWAVAGDGWALRSLQPKPFYDSLLCFSVNLKFNFLVFSETCYCKEDLEMFTTRNICVLTTYVDPQTDARPHEELTGAHTDWLTLNVGGRYFTTTR